MLFQMSLGYQGDGPFTLTLKIGRWSRILYTRTRSAAGNGYMSRGSERSPLIRSSTIANLSPQEGISLREKCNWASGAASVKSGKPPTGPTDISYPECPTSRSSFKNP
jgi:hypothetical protein